MKNMQKVIHTLMAEDVRAVEHLIKWNEANEVSGG
jgi:hypothetical protein